MFLHEKKKSFGILELQMNRNIHLCSAKTALGTYSALEVIKYKKNIWNFCDIIPETLDMNVWISGDIFSQTSEYHP